MGGGVGGGAGTVHTLHAGTHWRETISSMHLSSISTNPAYCSCMASALTGRYKCVKPCITPCIAPCIAPCITPCIEPGMASALAGRYTVRYTVHCMVRYIVR